MLQKSIDTDSVKAIGRNLSTLKIVQMMFWEDLARKKALAEQGKNLIDNGGVDYEAMTHHISDSRSSSLSPFKLRTCKILARLMCRYLIRESFMALTEPSVYSRKGAREMYLNFRALVGY